MNDETYIKMCDCVEIQEQRPRRVVYDREYNKYESHSFFVIRGDAKPSCKCGKYGRDWFGEIVCDRCGTTIEPLIWLPTQEQLQEMYGACNHIAYLCGLNDFAFGKRHGENMGHDAFVYPANFHSMTELALAMLMQHKHNKTWNGETWIGGNE